MSEVIQKLEQEQAEALISLNGLSNLAELEAWKQTHLGKTSSVMKAFGAMGSIAKEERPLLGQTINRVKRNINPNLKIEGALLTMVDNRTNFAKDISFVLRRDYGDKLRVFQTEIPLSIRAAETSAQGKSIYAFDPHGIAAKAYQAFTKEVQDIGEKRRAKQHQADLSR